MTQDELKSAIETVKRHQKWRRGGEGEPTNQKELGEAIDILIEAAEKYCHITAI